MSNHPLAERILTASSSLFLLVAPFTASAGWRAATLLVGFSAIVYLRGARDLSWPHPAPRALLAALLAWCLLAAASYFWSADPEHTLAELRREILYGALAFTVFYLAADLSRWRIWWPAMLVGAVVLVVGESLRGALEPALGMRTWAGGDGALSTHLVILAPLLLPLAWGLRADEPPRPVHFFAALLVLLAAAWATGNRMVWPALLLAFAVAAIARQRAVHQLPRLPKARYLTLAVLAVIAALAVNTALHRVSVHGVTPGIFAQSLQEDLRPRLWSIGLEQIARAPWLGHGFGREIAAGAFRPATPPLGNHPQLVHAHNVFLNVGVQLGLAGLALFAAVLLLLAREFARALRHGESAPAGILGLAVLAGFVAKNMTDDFLFRHNGLVFWAVMGMLLGLTRRKAP
jgi:O-antigen ligase